MKLITTLALAAFALVAQTPPKTQLQVGDAAPDFTLPFTGGCTKDMQAHQFGLDKFEGAETQVFGVSTANSPSQKRFAEDLKVVFPTLSDFATRSVSKEYGVVLAERGVATACSRLAGMS